jgi:hypothetical protein
MIEYRIDSERRVVSARSAGKVTFEEMLAWHRELRDDDRYSKEFSGVADMRGATLLLSPDEVAAIAKFNQDHDLTAGKWALLVDTPMETALAMIYGREAEGHHEMRVFATEEAASVWLGFDVAELLP